MSRRYSRVYESILTDPKFDTVRDDDRLLATWLRLLIAADGCWPAPVPVSRRTDQEALERLATVGLVDLLPGDYYRIHGLDSERVQRRGVVGGRARAEGAVRDGGRFVTSNTSETPATLDQQPPASSSRSRSRSRSNYSGGSGVEQARHAPPPVGRDLAEWNDVIGGRDDR